MSASEYKANFLWPFKEGSVEEAGYEFSNALTEEYRELWWNKLVIRASKKSITRPDNKRSGSSRCHFEVHQPIDR